MFAKQTENSLPSYLLILRKRVAFTLAEILITIGVIGVVAVLVMPMLINKIQENVRVSQVNAAYTLLFNATKNMIESEGTTINNLTTFPDSAVPTKFEELLPKYLDVVKVCDKAKSGCIANEYKALADSSFVAGITGTNYTYLLKNGLGLKIGSSGHCLQDMTLEKYLLNGVK